jgi:hypothetical protein
MSIDVDEWLMSEDVTSIQVAHVVDETTSKYVTVVSPHDDICRYLGLYSSSEPWDHDDDGRGADVDTNISGQGCVKIRKN